jgi:hypothetical protein
MMAGHPNGVSASRNRGQSTVSARRSTRGFVGNEPDPIVGRFFSTGIAEFVGRCTFILAAKVVAAVNFTLLLGFF